MGNNSAMDASASSEHAGTKSPRRIDMSSTESGDDASDTFEENLVSKENNKDAVINTSGGLPTDSVFVGQVGGGTGVVPGSADTFKAELTGSARDQPCYIRAWRRWCKFYNANSFLVLVLVVILLAYAYPPLGAVYLAPQITATWIAVMFIFILAGLGLKTSEFSKAFQRLYFNAFVHIFNFGVVSAGVFGFSRFLVAVGVLAQSLADGMVICACLPLTVNMVLVLTKSSGGDEAAAVFNAAFGNMVGVFLSPALILAYLGVQGEVNLGTVFFKLGLRVVLPITIGQVLQKFSQTAVAFVKKYKKYFKQAQEYCLVFIVYTVFCKTFLNGSDAGAGDIFIMIALQFCLLCAFMGLAWFVLKLLFPSQPTLRVMGLYGCTHKTVAMGVPLINAIYETNPLVGLYTLPLLIWHPMQLVLGSFLAPRLAAWVECEVKRLGTGEVASKDTVIQVGGEVIMGETASGSDSKEGPQEQP
uniref:Sodium/bile acid cotransporter n=1 Tax=Odontella aurita TaxID=265563 RepID=A0A7S4N788_9STRA|mmetsp:Transcript_50191/g.151094  ORF Transcript_50191/g.151094 Transcript_50191/m.151094 type:complete len:473 (+) Transcript_50191:337-1755(+)|eukprot:CAMPEP_0113542702 /NCGR_PEP_ID=MMETSP0015_2-20120614/9756_1 /TAXON_ID=2838 /ORGANISM="Odontella" /LENGTH=472 /DNA_ID=CAMNT_0000442793 /DNA_START=294 /DNA_END=1712 /DNA_ORIENTATION=- /assembly_acc=CAM_ASM_000160